MAFVIKFAKTVRNNWKKSVLFSAVAAYGGSWLKDIYDDSLIRAAYCQEAKKYGNQSLSTSNPIRKVTVFLNPAAKNGKAKKRFEKDVAPLLYLAGMEVTVVRTEYEGQAKKYMDVLDKPDAIVVAGGDGTVSEVLTGLLRRDDQEEMSRVPVGIIPLGYTNSLAHSLLPQQHSDVRWLSELAMSVIKGDTKPIDVMAITGDEGKTVYAVNQLRWGAFTEAEIRKKKYWYFGPLKHKMTYVLSTFGVWPPSVTAKLAYHLPCDGCSKCYTVPPKVQWRWWHIFFAPRQTVPEVDYSAVTNAECGNVHEQDVTCLQMQATTPNCTTKPQESDRLSLTVGPPQLDKMDFIRAGWRRVLGERSEEEENSSQHFNVGQFSLQPAGAAPEGHTKGEWWFEIDSEKFEVMSVDVRLLRHKLKVFTGGYPLPTHPQASL